MRAPSVHKLLLGPDAQSYREFLGSLSTTNFARPLTADELELEYRRLSGERSAGSIPSDLMSALSSKEPLNPEWFLALRALQRRAAPIDAALFERLMRHLEVRRSLRLCSPDRWATIMATACLGASFLDRLASTGDWRLFNSALKCNDLVWRRMHGHQPVGRTAVVAAHVAFESVSHQERVFERMGQA